MADEPEATFIVRASRELDPGSTGDVGPLIRLEPLVPGEPMPLRGVSYGVDTVCRILDGKLRPDMPLYTMRHKGRTWVMTLADLRLVTREE